VSKALRIACEAAGTLSLDVLEPFQGDLKDLSESDAARLRHEILTDGFSDPFNVWKHGEHNYIIDGHQRRTVLLALREGGYEIPPLPCVWVEADSMEQAKRKVLAQASQYGRVTFGGLSEFMPQADLDLAELDSSFRFPEIDADLFDDGKEWQPKKDGQDLSDGVETEHKCPACGYEW